MVGRQQQGTAQSSQLQQDLSQTLLKALARMRFLRYVPSALQSPMACFSCYCMFVLGTSSRLLQHLPYSAYSAAQGALTGHG